MSIIATSRMNSCEKPKLPRKNHAYSKSVELMCPCMDLYEETYLTETNCKRNSTSCLLFEFRVVTTIAKRAERHLGDISR